MVEEKKKEKRIRGRIKKKSFTQTEVCFKKKKKKKVMTGTERELKCCGEPPRKHMATSRMGKIQSAHIFYFFFGGGCVVVGVPNIRSGDQQESLSALSRRETRQQRGRRANVTVDQFWG